ncbi:MAG: ferredoxin family protein [Planctomycetaceae bacterium]|nr:ferredoxin family protein [Planctomycetaceae bacterium]
MQRIPVALSLGQSNNPVKRELEKDIVSQLANDARFDVIVISNLYDLKPKGEGVTALKEIKGDLILLTWLYSRAAHWLLNRHGIAGQEGTSELTYGDDNDNEEEDEPVTNEEDKPRVIDEMPLPSRQIYCLDMRASQTGSDFVEEIARITQEIRPNGDLIEWIAGKPEPDAMQRFLNPTNNTANGTPPPSHPITQIEEAGGRRWYPVIDFSRCTNCMECIDFCLFGVYGVDQKETILVEQPDNCRKGCPACSRVCPENAIIFPQHKSPGIAGAAVATEGLKIDLSKLFGGGENTEDAMQVAARERDEQLLLAGREAVGLDANIPKRQDGKANTTKDDLDDLIDELDDMEI